MSGLVEQPPFLTVDDFQHGALQCNIKRHEPAVCALTMRVPRTIYDEMTVDLNTNKIVLDGWYNKAKQVVYLREKIGESKAFEQRAANYRSYEHGMFYESSLIRSKFFIC